MKAEYLSSGDQGTLLKLEDVLLNNHTFLNRQQKQQKKKC